MQIRFGSAMSVTSGNPVLALGHMESTGHTTGLNFTDEVAQLVTYRDGRTIRVRDFASLAEGLEAAELSE
jgi:ketosteroid isomerase-like protein